MYGVPKLNTGMVQHGSNPGGLITLGDIKCVIIKNTKLKMNDAEFHITL